MKIAVLSINIGEYIVFWKEFYETAEINFLPECSKEYFVFTDADKLEYSEKNEVHMYYQKDMGWPNNTMKRFHLFAQIKLELQAFDYIFFANANARFMKPLTKDFILDGKNLITVEHPGKHGDDPRRGAWERRKESRAYVPYEQGRIYVQGAFYGGKANDFLEMVCTLDKLTEADLREGIIAVWHDESFLNMYIAGRYDVQILGWQYLKYEEVTYPYAPVIELRDKTKYIGKNNERFRGRENVFYRRFLQALREIKWKLFIRMGIYKWYEYIDKNGKYIDLDINNMC